MRSPIGLIAALVYLVKRVLNCVLRQTSDVIYSVAPVIGSCDRHFEAVAQRIHKSYLVLNTSPPSPGARSSIKPYLWFISEGETKGRDYALPYDGKRRLIARAKLPRGSTNDDGRSGKFDCVATTSLRK